MTGGAANSTNVLCLGSTCYTWNVAKLSITAAQTACSSAGGRLWNPGSEAEALAVQVYFGLVYTRGAIALGMNRAGSASAWVPVDGSTLTYTHW